MQHAAIHVSFSGRSRPRRCAPVVIAPQTLATGRLALRIGSLASHRSSPARRASPHRLSSAPFHNSAAVAKAMQC
jgi:hypothetical protein